MYVAIRSFIDPSDGQMIEADKSWVDSTSDVYRAFPGRFRLVTDGWLRERFGRGVRRMGQFADEIVRPSGVPVVLRSGSSPVPARVEIRSAPSWLLEGEAKPDWRL